jgi:hypothetical protein
MNTFSRVAIAMLGMTGLAAAQPKSDPKSAEAKADSKAPVAADPRSTGMPPMKRPPELAEVSKAVSGTWHCKGQAADPAMKMVDMTATLRMKLDLDNWWLHGSFESRMGKEAFHFESFTTFDPESKKWKRVMVESMGIWSNGESTGMKDNKVEWMLTTHTAKGDAMFRDREDMSDPKVGAKLAGDLSMDGGKTWQPVYQMTCKK